jgi:hypothetical protein
MKHGRRYQEMASHGSSVLRKLKSLSFEDTIRMFMGKA